MIEHIGCKNSLNKSFKYTSLVSASQSLHQYTVKILKKHGGV